VFADQPVAREVSDARAQTLPATFLPEEVRIENSVEPSAASELRPSLSLSVPGQGGALRLRLQGQAGRTYIVEGSSNLVQWEALDTVTLETATADFLAPGAGQASPRFYRLRLVR
jgi:hypothetical protein